MYIPYFEGYLIDSRSASYKLKIEYLNPLVVFLVFEVIWEEHFCSLASAEPCSLRHASIVVPLTNVLRNGEHLRGATFTNPNFLPPSL